MRKQGVHCYLNFKHYIFCSCLFYVCNEAAFLKNVKGKFDEAKGKFDEAKGKFDEAKGKIDEYKGKIDEAKGKFDEAKGKIDEYKGKIDEAKGKFDEAKGKIDEYKGKIDEYKGKFDEAKGKFDEAKGKIDEYKGKINIDCDSDTTKMVPVTTTTNITDNTKTTYNTTANDRDDVFAISSDITAKGVDNNEWYRKYSQKKIPYSLSQKIKLRFQEDKKLFGYLLFAFLFLILLCVIVCYLFYKEKNILAFQVLVFLVFNLILTLDLILVLFEHQSRISDHIELLKDFIFLCAASVMSFASGMFMMKEYFSKKRLP